jgi:fructose-1,6-bisphosphatase/inositol monophosphatase family enzyme
MEITRNDLKVVQQIVKSAAQTEIMPRFRNLSAEQISTKSRADDFVTEADQAAERVITKELEIAFPTAFVFGEESVAENPDLLEQLVNKDFAIIIDPIDGTANFVAEEPIFGTIIAVVIKGQVTAGLIYNPNTTEFTLALRGEGAWTEKADGTEEVLKLNQVTNLSELKGSGGLKFIPEHLRKEIEPNLNKAKSFEAISCCAHDYQALVKGERDFQFYYKLMPWDHAAGWLIHKEAGGYSALIDGSPYSPTKVEGLLLSAPNEQAWETLRAKVFFAFSG